MIQFLLSLISVILSIFGGILILYEFISKIRNFYKIVEIYEKRYYYWDKFKEFFKPTVSGDDFLYDPDTEDAIEIPLINEINKYEKSQMNTI